MPTGQRGKVAECLASQRPAERHAEPHQALFKQAAFITRSTMKLEASTSGSAEGAVEDKKAAVRWI